MLDTNLDGHDISAKIWDNVGYQIDGYEFLTFELTNTNWFEFDFEEVVYKSSLTMFYGLL